MTTAETFIAALREAVETCDNSISALAAKVGLSKQYLCDVLHVPPHRKPGEKLLAAMGWERVVTYRPVPKPKRRARNE